MMMIESTFPKYQTFNPKDPNCPVCAIINSLNGMESFQKKLEIPKAAGEGYYCKIVIKPSMIITCADIIFHDQIKMVGIQKNPGYALAFCLGEALRWRVEGNKKEYAIERDENYIFSGTDGKSMCYFNPGERFWGIHIHLEPEIIAGLIQSLGEERFRTGLFYGNGIVYKKKFSSTVKRILHEIINCRYRDDVKRIYLEGKILELVAVYLNESILGNGLKDSSIRLTASDRQVLHQAKRILEQNIASPPTLTRLAKLVCLNEYKLKAGFKQLYGTSVHAYVIDKRLEIARNLMEEQKLGVMEAVQLVGYSDASHFAEKFRKKYGVNPSEYVK
jgi:AraC-like DNA-binding protein